MIQAKKVDDDLLSTFFFTNVMMGVFLTGVFACDRPWLKSPRGAGEPSASGLMMVLGLLLLCRRSPRCITASCGGSSPSSGKLAQVEDHHGRGEQRHLRRHGGDGLRRLVLVVRPTRHA
ncbi:MAG: hypothetical protein R2705_10695 [Ilumatobacteraceae bacterium]